MFIEQLAKSVKAKREAKNLTQDDIGINGISRSMVSLLEIAKTDITVSKLKILADNIGIKVKDFFDFE
jgi:transcriptional regulator with XRE-family HTH domain